MRTLKVHNKISVKFIQQPHQPFWIKKVIMQFNMYILKNVHKIRIYEWIWLKLGLYINISMSQISLLVSVNCHFEIKKSGVTLTQLSLALHNSRRIFYYQHYLHISSLFSMLCSWWITCFYNYCLYFLNLISVFCLSVRLHSSNFYQ